MVDLGDTLAECTSALTGALGSEAQPGSMLQGRRNALLRAPGFWRSLAPRAAGLSLLAMLRDSGYGVTVLTKGPCDAPHVWVDKVAWCREHLPGVPVIVTDDKSLIGGDVLVDDWPPYVEKWQRSWPTGLAIMPAQPWNVHVAAGPLRLHDDGRNRDTIATALRARTGIGQYREGMRGGEPWGASARDCDR